MGPLQPITGPAAATDRPPGEKVDVSDRVLIIVCIAVGLVAILTGEFMRETYLDRHAYATEVSE
jgi:hypothetical protein